MKSVRVAVAAALMCLLVFAVPAAAAEPPPGIPDCSGRVDLDVDVAVELHAARGADLCRPAPGTPCTLHGLAGVIDWRGRCVCVPPTTTTPPTIVPSTTTPPTIAPQASPTVVVEVPVIERVESVVVAQPARPVRGAPAFTG